MAGIDYPEIRSPEELAAFADKFGLRFDWHEPDEQEMTVKVVGESFDNAMGTQPWPDMEGGYRQEITVALLHEGLCVAVINLANLLAWASAPHRGKR